MTNSYESKKAENCISSSCAYQYRFNFKLTEDFLNMFGNSADLKIQRNFPKPSFILVLSDGIRITGVLRDIAFKVIFPAENSEMSKNMFEVLLNEIIRNYNPEE